MMSRFLQLDTEPGCGGCHPVVVGEALDGPVGDDRRVLVIEVLVGDTPDGGGVDGVDPRADLKGREAAAVCEELAANVLAGRGGAVQLHEEGGLELVLGVGHLRVRHVHADADPVVLELVHEVAEAGLLVADNVEAKEASVRVAGVEGRV